MQTTLPLTRQGGATSKGQLWLASLLCCQCYGLGREAATWEHSKRLKSNQSSLAVHVQGTACFSALLPVLRPWERGYNLGTFETTEIKPIFLGCARRRPLCRAERTTHQEVDYRCTQPLARKNSASASGRG
eukprot:3724499-Amphidinium_carterae.1